VSQSVNKQDRYKALRLGVDPDVGKYAIMGQIRACVPEDVPRVADLFQVILRGLPVPAPRSLQQYLLELFFKPPSLDPELPSLVYIAPDGAVGGFIGVIPSRMSFRGKPIRAAIGSSFMVEKVKDSPFAGAALLKAFLSGPQELSITDSANSIAEPMWKQFGGQLLRLESMQWLRVLRPGGLILSRFLAIEFPLPVARPICVAVDRIVAPHRFQLKAKVMARTIDIDRNDDLLLNYFGEFAAQYSLRPIWEVDCLKWRLSHAAQNRRLGKLVCRAVYGKTALLGCYLYYSRPHGIAKVLQIMTSSDAVGMVLDSLLEDAYQNRCVAVRGRAHSRLMDELLSHNCIFFGSGSVLVHSRNADIMEEACSGNAFLSGLAGEEWSRIVEDDFN
jgi:hypothetical protein